MKRLWISAGVLLLGLAASAQTLPPAANWVDEVLPQGASKPSGDGTHNCLSQYPETAKAAHSEGTTSLTYRIAEDGSVKAVKVTKSSGNAVLDKAAVVCVKAWHYAPATLEGKPIETPWRNDVKWVIAVYGMGHPILPPPAARPPGPPPPPPVNAITVQRDVSTPPPISTPAAIGRPHVCSQLYPPDAVQELAEGTTLLAFKITAEGTTKDIIVAQSSGYASLDEAAVTCASTWRYKPAVENNQPVEVLWKALVKWALT